MAKSRSRENQQNQHEAGPTEPPAWYKEAQKDRNLYEILGVNRDHPQGGIHKAYRKRATKVHPDVNPEYRVEAEEEFKDLQDAYEILNNPLWRDAYDNGGFDAVDALRGRRGGGPRPGQAKTWGQAGAGTGSGAGAGAGSGRGAGAGAGTGSGAGAGAGSGRGAGAGAGAGSGAGAGTGSGAGAGAGSGRGAGAGAGAGSGGSRPGPDTGTRGRAGNPDAGADTSDAPGGDTQDTGWRYDPRKWWRKYQQRRKGPESQDPPDFDGGPTSDETNFNTPPSAERQAANEKWANGRHGKDFVKELEDLNDRLNGDVEKFNRLDPIHLERARAAKELYNTLYPRVKVAFDNQLFELTGLTLGQIAREMGPEGKKFEDDFILWVLRQSWEDVASPDIGALETIIDTDELVAKHKARLERIKRYTDPGYVRSETAKQELFERGYGRTRWRWRDAKAAQDEIDKKHPGEADSGWFSEVNNWRKIQEIKKNVEYAKTKAGPEAARAKETIKRRRAEIFTELDNLNGLVTEVENPATDKEDLNPLVGFRNMFNARIKRVMEVPVSTTYDLPLADYKMRADQAEAVLGQTKKVAEQLRQARLNGESTEAFNVYKDNAGREEQELGRLAEAVVERLKDEYLSKIAHALFSANGNRAGELPPISDIRKYVNRMTQHQTLTPRKASDALYAGAKALADKYAAETQDAADIKLSTLSAMKTVLDKLNA